MQFYIIKRGERLLCVLLLCLEHDASEDAPLQAIHDLCKAVLTPPVMP